jgi:hypothetical protein
MGVRVVRLVLAAGVCCAALSLLPELAAAAGKTFYASPSAEAAGACTQPDPCPIPQALTKAGDGDSISLAGGSGPYILPPGGITIEDEVDFGAQPGAPATLVSSISSTGLHVTPVADAKVHDVALQGEGGFELDSGIGERVSVALVGLADDACVLEKGTTLRDSLCWTREVNEEDEGVSHGLAIGSGGEGQDEPVVLRNVTAVASNAAGDGVFAEGAGGAKLTVDAANVIARSENAFDVFAKRLGGLSETHVNITHSSFATFSDEPSMATVTPPGTNGNLSAPILFVQPAFWGDFHLSGGSPGLDGGIADGSVGTLDLDGHQRAQSKCIGTAAVPDMGAYERAPTDACPPPPPPPPPPFEPRKPVFRIIKLNLNKRTGGGSMQVEVPSGGTLTLTGSGIKLVRRRAASPGDLVTMPIQPWAITRVRLAKTGKTKVRLKLTFEPQRGPPDLLSMKVQLRKNRG